MSACVNAGIVVVAVDRLLRCLTKATSYSIPSTTDLRYVEDGLEVDVQHPERRPASLVITTKER